MAYGKPHLRGTELATMMLLWRHEKMSRRELQQALATGGKPVASGTIQKCLARLASKGYVVHDRSRMPHTFQATIPIEGYVIEQVSVLLNDEASDAVIAFLKRLLQYQKRSGR
jgi:predicted transcriptional regulator